MPETEHHWWQRAERSPLGAADLARCRDILRRGSRSFTAASWLLPRRMRDAAAAVYAFCRVADDAVDLGSPAGDPLARLEERLQRIYGEGAAADPALGPADRAFAAVVQAYCIPRAVPQALLEGFRWDLAGRRYQTIAETRAYAVRVASTVGVMMTLLMGRRHPAVLARACDLGVAMQLTNIARDVGEDAAAGRLYLPLEWLQTEGLDPERWLARPVFAPALSRVVERLLEEAGRLYRQADRGITYLPPDCQGAIRAARLIYAEIGAVIRTAGHDSVTQRAVTSPGRKAALLLRALASTLGRRMQEPPATECPPLPEAAFLVEAASVSAEPG